jgi:hypothetical protein
MSDKPLYFPTQEGNPKLFSGYGIPLKEGTKSPLVGMLLLDRPTKCPPEYLDRVRNTFGDYQIRLMTSKGERGCTLGGRRLGSDLKIEILCYP